MRTIVAVISTIVSLFACTHCVSQDKFTFSVPMFYNLDSIEVNNCKDLIDKLHAKQQNILLKNKSLSDKLAYINKLQANINDLKKKRDLLHIEYKKEKSEFEKTSEYDARITSINKKLEEIALQTFKDGVIIANEQKVVEKIIDNEYRNIANNMSLNTTLIISMICEEVSYDADKEQLTLILRQQTEFQGGEIRRVIENYEGRNITVHEHHSGMIGIGLVCSEGKPENIYYGTKLKVTLGNFKNIDAAKTSKEWLNRRRTLEIVGSVIHVKQSYTKGQIRNANSVELILGTLTREIPIYNRECNYVGYIIAHIPDVNASFLSLSPKDKLSVNIKSTP